jgi:cell division transport system permease protein
MITTFIKKAIQDIFANHLLNTITIITIGLSILIVSAFTLFFLNANAAIASWQKGIRVLVYLKPEADETTISALKKEIQQLQAVQDIHFISREAGLALLKERMKATAALLENLEPNPLPDAFEIRVQAKSQQMNAISELAHKIKGMAMVESVEYGQQWFGRFINILNLFKLAGYGMGGLFVIATLFIIANTIRLVLYSRKEEIEIMRLVGATDRFIKTPFYIEGLILGALGGALGSVALFAAYHFILSKFGQAVATSIFEIHFFSLPQLVIILLGSMGIGWIGCFLSLKQFLKS